MLYYSLANHAGLEVTAGADLLVVEDAGEVFAESPSVAQAAIAADGVW